MSLFRLPSIVEFIKLYKKSGVQAAVSTLVGSGNGVFGTTPVSSSAGFNGPIGATTPATGSFTTVNTTGVATINSGYSGDGTARIGSGAGGYSNVHFAKAGGGSNDYRGYISYNHASDQFEIGAGAAQRGIWGATGINSTNIGATTPGTGAFTTLSASGLSNSLGASLLTSPIGYPSLALGNNVAIQDNGTASANAIILFNGYRNSGGQYIARATGAAWGIFTGPTSVDIAYAPSVTAGSSLSYAAVVSTTPTGLSVTGAISATGTSTLTGNVGIGGAVSTTRGLSVSPTIVAASTIAVGISNLATLTTSAGDNIYGALFDGNYTTSTGASLVAAARFQGRTVTVTTGTLTDAATVSIQGPMAGATNNYALKVDSGATSLGGTLKTASTISVGNATPAASGAGVTYPATQNPSSDPNTLDDYDEYTAASAACTGAITTAAVWKLTKVGNKVTLTLPAVAGAAGSTVASFSYGTIIPAKYRPTSQLVFPVVVLNDVVQNAPGLLSIATTGGISVYKTLDAAGTFTNTFNAGLGQSSGVSVSWTI